MGYWQHLCIDMDRYECDPTVMWRMIAAGLECRPETIEASARFERLAGRIHGFTEQTRDFLPPVWTYNKPKPGSLDEWPELKTVIEKATGPHIVEWQPQDPVLGKTQQSVVAEHGDFFKELQERGVIGFTVSGGSLSACVMQSSLDLMERGFRIALLEGLYDDRRPHEIPAARTKLISAGASFIAPGEIIRTRGAALTGQAPFVLDL